MKERYRHSRSGVFLMEIIVAICFFSLVSASCLKLFVKSHDLSAETEQLNAAVRYSTTIAETLKSAKSADEAEALVFDLLDGNLSLKDNLRAEAAEDGLIINVEPGESSQDLDAWDITISAKDAGPEDPAVYDLHVEVYYEE